MTMTVDAQGQITLTEHVRDILGIVPGSKLVLDADEQGELILRPERVAVVADPDRFKKARGILPPYPGGTDALMNLLRGDD